MSRTPPPDEVVAMYGEAAAELLIREYTPPANPIVVPHLTQETHTAVTKITDTERQSGDSYDLPCTD